MEFERAQASLQTAELCLAHGWVDSAVNRAYFALFQAAICALEQRGCDDVNGPTKVSIVILCNSLSVDGNSSLPALPGPCLA
jgi:hypothetical protein